MQNAGIRALGLNWRYLAFEVHPDSLRSAISGALAMKFVGLNLTIPHKLLAVEMVDELDETARTWGAVNTIRFEGAGPDGTWKPLPDFPPGAPIEHYRSRGYNTDADAITRSLREDLQCDLAGAKVMVLGAGGAGRVAALKLASESVRTLHVVNRTREKAAELAAEVRRKFPGVQAFEGLSPEPVDLIVNATSLGLKPSDPLPIDPQSFDLANAAAVYDMIYRPAETPLLASARAAGCRTANGLGMLLYQGAKALEIWAGQTAPVEEMRQALKNHIYGHV